MTIADHMAHSVNADERQGRERPGLRYALDTLGFSGDMEKAFLQRLQSVLGHAEIMAL
jgi:hypothetical protein